MGGSKVGPFFLSCTTPQAIVGWLGIVANLMLVMWCAFWIGTNCGAMSGLHYWFIPNVLVALFLADFFSGGVHWFTDTWFDEIVGGRVIAIAREHHLYPRHIVGYGFRDYVAYSSWPSILVIGPILLFLTLAIQASLLTFNLVCIFSVIAAIMSFGTYAHRLGHIRAESPILRFLQRAHLLMGPQHHAVHHRGNHDIRYCVVNGWANHVCDRVGFWRGLEKLIEMTTGAVPRTHDHVCFALFERDRLFLTKSTWDDSKLPNAGTT